MNQAKHDDSFTPLMMIGFGVFLGIVGTVPGAALMAASEGRGGFFLGGLAITVVAGVIATLMIAVGVIAKGVQIGLRERDRVG